MVTEKHKTTLEIGIEDRMLRRFGETMRRVFSTEPIERHRRAQEQVTKELEKQRRAAEQAVTSATGKQTTPRDARGRFIPAGGAPGGGGGGPGGGPGGGQGAPVGQGGGGRQPMGFAGTAAATGVGFLGGQAIGRGAGAMAGMARGTGATAAALGALPIVGPVFQGAIQAAEALTDMAVGAGQARAMTAGQTGMGATTGMGMSQFGISQQQLPGKLAQLSQQSGMRGADLKALAPDALRLEALTGISGGVMAGAAGAGGGQVSAQEATNLTMEAIAAGMDAGFRDAKLGQFIGQIAGDIEQMRSRGIMVDPNALPAMVRMFGATGRLGLQGESAAHAAKTMTDAVQGAGQRNDFYGALAMQGFMDQMNPETGEKYTAFEAQMALEESPEKGAKIVLDRIGKMGGSDEAKAMALKQFMPGLSTRQAFEMAKGAGTGEFGLGKGSREQGAAYVDSQQEATKGAFGLAGKAASLQDEQIAGGGGEVAGGIFAMRRREVDLAKQGAGLGAKAADFTSGIIKKYGDALASDNPLGAVFAQLGQDASSLFGTIAENLTEAMNTLVKKVTGIDSMEQAGRELANITAEDAWGAMKEMAKDVRKIFEWLANLKLPGGFSLGSLLGYPAEQAAPSGKMLHAGPGT